MLALRRCILLAAVLLVALPTAALASDQRGKSDHGPGSRGRGQEGRGQGHGRGQDRDGDVRRGERDAHDAEGRVVVCHVTGSDSNSVVVLVLPEQAARAHERHGDVVLDNDDGDVGQRCQDAVDAGQGVDRPFSGQCLGQGNLAQRPSAVATQSGRVTLSWQVDPFAVAYRIYLALQPGMSLTLAQVVPSGGAASATLGGLIPGQSYSFEVRALRPNGMEQAVVASAQGSAPILASASLCVSVEATTATTATLTWGPVRRADSYVVLQALGTGQPFVPASLASFSSDEATVVGLAPGRAYLFQVIALDAAGHQLAPSNVVAVTTPAA